MANLDYLDVLELIKVVDDLQLCIAIFTTEEQRARGLPTDSAAYNADELVELADVLKARLRSQM